MAIHVLRDYAAAASGYYSPGGGIQYYYTPYFYNLSIFLRRVLGYSNVGSSFWDIEGTNVQTFNNAATAAIASGSSGQTLPQSTIFVQSTSGFPNSGTIWVTTSNGIQTVTYSGLTVNAFLNCVGGTGTMTSGSFTTIAALSNGTTLPQSIVNVAANTTANTLITAASNGVSLPTATINVTSTTGFPTSGTLNVTTGAGVQTVTYTGVTALTFTGCAGGTGTMSTGGAVNNTGFFTPFPTSGNIYVVTSLGVQTVAYTNPSTTIAVASNGQSLPQATINVASATGFPSSGAITVVTSNGPQTVTYTSAGTNTFAGCTGGTGTMTTGNSVTSATSFGGASGGIGVINTGNSVTTAGNSVACSPLKVIAGSGSTSVPWTVTTNFPHGITGNYATIAAATGNLPNGPWPISTPSSTQLILQTTSGGSLTGTANVYPPNMLVASGTVLGGTGATINVTGASSVYAVSIPPNVRTVQPGAAPTSGDVGRILVLKSSSYPTKNSGLFKISAVNTGNSTTIAAASNGATLPQSTINVASTTGFPASGTLFVYTSTGVQTVTYTGGGGGGTTFTGCSGGTGVLTTGNTVNNFNGYTIDYRSTDTPPNETMDWWLYDIETQASLYVGYPNNGAVTGVGFLSTTNTAPIQVTTNINVHGDWITGQKVSISGVTGNTNANGNWTITVQNPNTQSGIFTLNGSQGNGTSTTSGTVTRTGYQGGAFSFNSKIILQSPHSSGWQVRLAVEPFNITSFPVTSVCTGYGGNSVGDFAIGGPHTHLAQFTDTTPVSNASITSMLPGSSYTGAIAIRTTMVGDDTGQAVFCYARSQGAGANGITTFGLPDNEPTPLPVNINRPFTYGGVSSSDFGSIQMRFGTTLNFGLTFRDSIPEVAAMAGLANVDGVSGSSPVFSANAGDSPFTGTTEVVPWEIWGGAAGDVSMNLPFNGALGPSVLTLNQRIMGTAPFIRQGRTNFGNFTLSTDSTATSSVSAASATSPIQITTSATNALATGQTVTITGVQGLSGANGTWVITVIDNTHFTLNGSTGTGTYTSGGSVVGTAHWLHLQNGIYLQWNGAGGLTP